MHTYDMSNIVMQYLSAEIAFTPKFVFEHEMLLQNNNVRLISKQTILYQNIPDLSSNFECFHVIQT